MPFIQDHHYCRALVPIFAGALLVMSLAACGPGKESAVQAPALEVLVTEATRRDVPLTLDMVGTTMGGGWLTDEEAAAAAEAQTASTPSVQ
jgi:hypothetical protein